MNPRLSLVRLCFVGVTLLATLLLTRSAATQNQPAQTNVRTENGVTTVTFNINPGTIRVLLPDDMRAGDTISGTVLTEPTGTNDQEKQQNAQALKIFVIDIQGSRVSTGDNFFSFPIPANEPKAGEFLSEGKMDMRLLQPPNWTVLAQASVHFVLLPPDGVTTPNPKVNPPKTESGAVITPNPKITVPKTESGAVVTPDPKITSRTEASTAPLTFNFPALGQQGRPIEIFGPFDGDSSNTWLRGEREVAKLFEKPPTIDPSGSKEFTEQFSNENFLKGLSPVAESPRKAVFIAPTSVTGPFAITLSEAGKETKDTYRNLGVRLSAPKTNLMRGERTIVTVEVRGLEGIKNDVPLQLDSKGVITMDGGNFQNLRIKPNEVQNDGRFITTRQITGQQAGGFTVTATVIVRRFDLALQDDADPNRIFHFNSFTGDYVFACGGGSCKPDGPGGTQTRGKSSDQPGAPPVSPSPVNVFGTGKPLMKGCIITLSHNTPDRRVFARLDACTKSGDASVETTSPKQRINITDKNTTDNTASSPK